MSYGERAGDAGLDLELRSAEGRFGQKHDLHEPGGLLRGCETILIVDLDPQSSASLWHVERGTNKPNVLDAMPDKLTKIIESAPALGISLCLIDSPNLSRPVRMRQRSRNCAGSQVRQASASRR
jgi:hypothetical protein